MARKELSKEKEILAMEISLTPIFIAFFITVFYLLYLKTIGVELSDQFFISSLIFVAIGSFIVCMALNEVLLKMYGGQFKFKRLVFRWILLISYFSLVYGTYLCLSLLFPWATLFWLFFFGALPTTVIFVAIALKARRLFSKLDKGEW